MKKTFILLVITLLALAFDGTLEKDIFDYRLNSFKEWMVIIMIVAIILSISWANSTKDD